MALGLGVIGGVFGGFIAGSVQAWTLIFYRSMLIRRREAKTARMREEVQREWCDNCGQRLGKDHPDICMPGVT